jgi:membrane protein YqaA with SNARE-associated domain
MGMVRDLVQWVLAWAQTPWSDAALAALAFAESSFFPVPPDTLLITLALARPEHAFWLAGLCTVASVLGGLFGYLIGRVGGRPLALRLFGQQRVAAAEALYKRYDTWAVFLAGFTPIPYKVFTIAAGVCALDVPRFTLASLLGRGARFFLVAAVIFVFGEPIRHLLERYLELAAAVLGLLIVAGFGALHLIQKRHRSSAVAREGEQVT